MSRRPDRALGVSRGLQAGVRKPGHRSFNPDHNRNRRPFTLGQAIRMAGWVMAIAWFVAMVRPLLRPALLAVLP